MADDCAFADLRRLADALSAVETRALRAAAHRSIVQLVTKLGVTSIGLLGRTLRTGSPITREAARDALANLAARSAGERARVLAELRAVIGNELSAASDDVKVCALGLLAELGEPSAARFSDPAAIQRRSALALAAQLEAPNDVANAADMMVKGLDDRDVVQMMEVLLDVAPSAAHRLAGELALRLDVDADQRARIASVVADAFVEPVVAAAPRTPRPTHVAVLVDATARIVVVATRKMNGERRWRRWAVLIGEAGCIDDCLHEEASADARGLDPTATLIANLCADGYRVASNELDHARALVATAARRTTRTRDDNALASGYYVGRDLLDLRDAHVISAQLGESPTLARAVDLLAAGDAPAARALFERCPAEITSTADWCGAYGACLLSLGEQVAAIEPLERAIAAEPAWPLHYWNLAVALHQINDSRGCHTALRRFLSTSGARSALVDDAEQPNRLAQAKLMLAEIERVARLDRSVSRKRAAPARPRATARRRKKPAR